LTPFSLGCTPHVQRKACTDLRLRAHAIDVAVHLAVAPVPTFHGIGCGGQQPVIEKRQGFFQCGGKELLEGFAQEREPQEPTPQFGQFVEGGLGPTAPVEQGVPLCHERTQRADLGQPTGDTPQSLTFGFAQVPLDDQRAMSEQRGALRFEPLFRAGCLLCCWRTRAPFVQWGLLDYQALAGAGYGTSDRFAYLGPNRKRTDLMRDIPEDLGERHGIER
jgi:hypothetical protein